MAIPFLIGWVVGMAVVVVVAAFGANALPIRPFRTTQKAIGIAEIIVGVGVLVIAVLYLAAGGEGPADPTEQVARQRRTAGTRDGARTGRRLEPPTEGSAARDRGRSGDRRCQADRDGRCSSSSSSTWRWRPPRVTVPIIATLVSPTRMQPRLVVARDWLDRNGGHITVVVLLLVGFVILGDGLTRL